MKDYESVRNNLLDMLEDLDDRLKKITDDVKHEKEPLSKDSEDLATQMENNEVLDELGNLTQQEITQVKTAISRIDTGDYGYCVICGEAIKTARLNAVPYSDKCIKCAQKEATNG